MPHKTRIWCNTVQLRKIVGWAYRGETQQSHENVGFRSSTQPTHYALIRFLVLTELYWDMVGNTYTTLSKFKQILTNT